MDKKDEAQEQARPLMPVAPKTRRISYAKLSKVVQAKISLANIERLAMLHNWKDADLRTGMALVRKGLEATEQKEAK